jgi:outer membrane lipoprotein LolB
MTTHCLRSAIAILIAATLVACAPVRVKESAQTNSAQTAREAKLASNTHWTITAHIGVSDGKDGGSGDLVWKQNGDDYDFTVHAPVTGKTWKLSGDASHATLEGVDPQPDIDSNPEKLLKERLGWDVPLSKLGAWARGLRAPGSQAQTQFDAQDLPAVIEQDGWKVEYRDWYADRSPPLPRKLFASRGSAHVRMSIENWSIDE